VPAKKVSPIQRQLLNPKAVDFMMHEIAKHAHGEGAMQVMHVRRSRRPVDGAKALRAVAQREGQRINGPARLESLRIYSRRIEGEASSGPIGTIGLL
jgi:hypothetical protein